MQKNYAQDKKNENAQNQKEFQTSQKQKPF